MGKCNLGFADKAWSFKRVHCRACKLRPSLSHHCLVSECVWSKNFRNIRSICVWLCRSKRLNHQDSNDTKDLQKISLIHPSRPNWNSLNDLLRGGDLAEPCINDLLLNCHYLPNRYDSAVIQWWHQGQFYGRYSRIDANEAQASVDEK